MSEYNFENLKKFVGVKFYGYGEANDIICKDWIIEKDANMATKWPASNAVDLARNRTKPGADWLIYDIEVLCHGSKLIFNVVFLM
jgi:hypothetical protein